MPTDVMMPQMGESIFEGTLTKWLKQVGDKVVRDEPLFEISTDKVDAEIPAPATGTLLKSRPEAATVQVNTVVAVLAEEGAAAPAAQQLHQRPPHPHRRRKRHQNRRPHRPSQKLPSQHPKPQAQARMSPCPRWANRSLKAL